MFPHLQWNWEEYKDHPAQSSWGKQKLSSITLLWPWHSDGPPLGFWLWFRGWTSEECATFFLRWPSSEGSVIQQIWTTTVVSLLRGDSWGQFSKERNMVQTSLVPTTGASKDSWRSWRRKRNWEKGNGFRGTLSEGWPNFPCSEFSF